MAPPINPNVLEAFDAMCRGVGIDQTIQHNGLKNSRAEAPGTSGMQQHEYQKHHQHSGKSLVRRSSSV